MGPSASSCGSPTVRPPFCTSRYIPSEQPCEIRPGFALGLYEVSTQDRLCDAVAPPVEIWPTFTLYNWSNPHMTAVDSFLARATGRSALLSFGDNDIGFDLRLSAEAAHWLAPEFERTSQGLILKISTVRYLLEATFAGGVECGLLSFDEQLALRHAGDVCTCPAPPC